MSNWIEKALDEIGNSAIGDREHWKSIILSHAPVIDAEALSKQKCISCDNVPDEINRASICRTCWVQWGQLKAERDKAIEVLAKTQKALKEK